MVSICRRLPTADGARRRTSLADFKAHQCATDGVHVLFAQHDIGGAGVFDRLGGIERTGQYAGDARTIQCPTQRELGERDFFLIGQRFEQFKKSIGFADAVVGEMRVDVA